MPWVEVRHDDGRGELGERFDAILINAGVTHPLEAWLDAMAERARMILPLTVAMSAQIGKGLLVLLTRSPESPSPAAKAVTFLAIYNALKVRDESIARELGAAL